MELKDFWAALKGIYALLLGMSMIVLIVATPVLMARHFDNWWWTLLYLIILPAMGALFIVAHLDKD